MYLRQDSRIIPRTEAFRNVAIFLPGFQKRITNLSTVLRMYIYHTTDHRVFNTMGRSVLAVSMDDGRTFRYLYDLTTMRR